MDRAAQAGGLALGDAVARVDAGDAMAQLLDLLADRVGLSVVAVPAAVVVAVPEAIVIAIPAAVVVAVLLRIILRLGGDRDGQRRAGDESGDQGLAELTHKMLLRVGHKGVTTRSCLRPVL